MLELALDIVEPRRSLVVEIAMRDDLHKGAPMPMSFRRLIKACTDRDAELAITRANEAVEQELRSEISETTVKRALETFAGPQLTLRPPDRVDLWSEDEPHSALEGRFVDYLEREAATSRATPDVVQRALVNTMQERLAAHIRAIDSHIAVKSPRDRFEVMTRLRAALRNAPVESRCHDLLAGNKNPSRPLRRKRATFDLEKDLSR